MAFFFGLFFADVDINSSDDFAGLAFVEFDFESGVSKAVGWIFVDEFALVDGDAPLLFEAFFDLLWRDGTKHSAVRADFGFEFDVDVLKALR